MRFYKTTHEIRSDQVAYEVFGDVSYTKKIIRLNPEACKMPLIPAGELLKLPPVEREEPKGVNLWS